MEAGNGDEDHELDGGVEDDDDDDGGDGEVQEVPPSLSKRKRDGDDGSDDDNVVDYGKSSKKRQLKRMVGIRGNRKSCRNSLDQFLFCGGLGRVYSHQSGTSKYILEGNCVMDDGYTIFKRSLMIYFPAVILEMAVVLFCSNGSWELLQPALPTWFQSGNFNLKGWEGGRGWGLKLDKETSHHLSYSL